MSSFCYSTFFQQQYSIYAIFDDQRFNDMLTNDAISFEQLGHGVLQPFQHFLRHIEMMERMIIKISVQ